MANIFSRLLNRSDKQEDRSALNEEWHNPVYGTLTYSTFNSYTTSKALKLSTVYRAVTLISDSVAVLELNNFKYNGNWKEKQYDNLYYLLNVQPNPLMSAHTFKKIIVQSMLLKGNAFVLITRNAKLQPERLDILDADQIEVYFENEKLLYKSNRTGNIYDSADIIHVLNYSDSGYRGISTLDYASMALGTAYSSEQHANSFFQGGGAMAGILSPIAGVNITPAKAASAKAAFKNNADISVGGESNQIIVLDSGLQYQPISVSPRDSQLLESRQFNITTIAQFFGVPPSKLFDMSKTSYASAEASQIDFLNSTLLPLLEKIELEFYRKLYSKIEYSTTELKFNVENLLRLDASTQATVWNQLYQIGAISTNEIREKLNMNNPAKGGNRYFIGQNYQPLDNLTNDAKAPVAVISGATKQ